MSSLLSIPDELLVHILSYLPRADLKAYRTVSRECAALVTPILFQEVPFHLEPGGCNNLDHIARVAHLARHVRTVRLQRAKGMHRFDNYDTWMQATVYEHEPNEDDEDLVGPSSSPPTNVRSMSHEEWGALDSAARLRLYDQYQQDVRATDEYFVRFASAILAALSSQYTAPLRPLPADANTDAMQLLSCYRRATTFLRHVQTFFYVPAYRVDELGWGDSWHGISFHEYTSVHVGWGFDPHYDAIQLFAALAISDFPSEPPALRSLTLTTQGGAFWTVDHLIRLLHWMRESPEGRDHSVPTDYLDFDRPLNREAWEHTIARVEELTRALSATERRFGSLVRLECRVDILWEDRGHQGDEAIALEVAQCIREAKGLEWLRLAFGEDVHEDDHPPRHFNIDYRPNQASPPATSQYLLSAVAGLRHLRHLHLTLETTATDLKKAFKNLHHLSSLQISCTALIKGTWDDVLKFILDNLALNQIELVTLEDIMHDQPRVLLNENAPAWRSAPAGWYQDYREGILSYVLGSSHVPPSLCPNTYIAARSRH